MTSPGKAQVVGTGLIGGSIGLALRRAGWHVTGHDADEQSAATALAMGAIGIVLVAATFVLASYGAAKKKTKAVTDDFVQALKDEKAGVAIEDCWR